jgi:anti-sigma regulatory factor (Ser/Thr protein kinase)
VNVDMRLDGTPAAAARARAAIEGFAADMPERRLRDVRLLVSELVTNSVRHAGLRAGETIHLLASITGAVLRVEVHDPGSGFERRRTPAPDSGRAGGWGLVLVAELADRWGMDDAGAGTRIWFELSAA